MNGYTLNGPPGNPLTASHPGTTSDTLQRQRPTLDIPCRRSSPGHPWHVHTDTGGPRLARCRRSHGAGDARQHATEASPEAPG